MTRYPRDMQGYGPTPQMHNGPVVRRSPCSWC